jgi:hypothetical protein
VKKTDKLPDLRRLYVEGNSLAVAAKMAGVSRGSAAAWRAEDEAASKQSWDGLRQQQLSANPLAPLAAAREYLQWLLDNQRTLRTQAGFADSLWKAQQVVEKLEAKLSDPERIIAALKVFANHVAHGLDDERLGWLHRIVEGFRDDLKAGKVRAV